MQLLTEGETGQQIKSLEALLRDCAQLKHAESAIIRVKNKQSFDKKEKK